MNITRRGRVAKRRLKDLPRGQWAVLAARERGLGAQVKGPWLYLGLGQGKWIDFDRMQTDPELGVRCESDESEVLWIDPPEIIVDVASSR